MFRVQRKKLLPQLGLGYILGSFGSPSGHPGRHRPGLQDGLFSNQKSKFGYILEALECKMLLYFITIWNYFTALWYNVWPLGIVCGHLVYFSRFGIFGP
jgi:hypothetical protein